MEDGEGIFAVVHTAGREDDGDEMDACVIQQWRRARFGKKL